MGPKSETMKTGAKETRSSKSSDDCWSIHDSLVSLPIQSVRCIIAQQILGVTKLWSEEAECEDDTQYARFESTVQRYSPHDGIFLVTGKNEPRRSVIYPNKPLSLDDCLSLDMQTEVDTSLRSVSQVRSSVIRYSLEPGMTRARSSG